MDNMTKSMLPNLLPVFGAILFAASLSAASLSAAPTVVELPTVPLTINGNKLTVEVARKTNPGRRTAATARPRASAKGSARSRAK